ncbi:phage antirepressor KilAC domain-containing protein [Paenibacillus alvei]|nr:phage antirepressor KilAC domain-containing protein [Paenibacillus alvei]MCY9544531.1 phage antirepressor KilAC domain-containing protein [Paenibacillus alvei]MCY9736080.1 phage antirepressor KilAC domain-containing protein [Paenibacillus alvei]MCY9755856.1 phage antirepressor KilAC domain-containing protein [Paenibacillus alvei]MEC0082275.1 phage antirepressor KilAC domain-containing protein [Paenibacillus alvei]
MTRKAVSPKVTNRLRVIEHNNQCVLMTVQLAESFGTTPQIITNNFNRNKERYTEGKHYFGLSGQEKRNFLNQHQNDLSLKNAAVLYLWTEKGAWMHAKSLNTDQAWDAYEMLVDEYYRQKENVQMIPRSFPEALRLAAELAEKNEALSLQNAQKEQIISELKPKATYYDLVLQTKSVLAISKIAKDYGMSATAMNRLLHELGVQYKQGECWLLYQKHADKGYTQSKTQVIDEERSKLHTYWTQKGRLFIYELLKRERGLLPIIEREGVTE